MPILVTWDDESYTILRQTVQGEWSLLDAGAAFRHIYYEMRQVDHPVHIITTIEGKLHLPKGLLSGLAFMEKHKPLNEGLHIIVGAGVFGRALYNTARIINNRVMKDTYLVDTLDEAYVLLAGAEVMRQI